MWGGSVRWRTEESVRVRDRESQTSELSGERDSMLGIPKMTGEYTGIGDTVCLQCLLAMTGEHTGCTDIVSTVCWVF